VQTVFPGTKRRKAGKVGVRCDVTSDGALPSDETQPVATDDTAGSNAEG